jgi:hypothetical protein
MSREIGTPETARRIHDALDVGAVADGRDVVLNLRMEDASTEWFAVHHTKVGRLVASIMYGAGVAGTDRPRTTPLGNNLPEQANVIDPWGMKVIPVPDAGFVVFRVSFSEEVHMDFRMPIQAATTIQDQCAQAIAVLSQFGKQSSSH